MSVLFLMVFRLVGPPLEVAQGELMELLMGYLPSDVVSLVGGRPCLIFPKVALGTLFDFPLKLFVG